MFSTKNCRLLNRKIPEKLGAQTGKRAYLNKENKLVFQLEDNHRRPFKKFKNVH